MGMLDNMLVDPSAPQTALPDWLRNLLGGAAQNQRNSAQPFGALAPAVLGQNGTPAMPDADGVYRRDAVMQPPEQVPMPQPRPASAPQIGDDTLPPNATPTVGTAPFGMAPPVPQPSASAPSAPPGLFDRLSAASHNLSARPGLPGMFDAISGAQTGQRLDPQGMALQGQNATVRALIAKGVSPDLAEAARLNPEILKQLLPAFGPKAYKFETTPDGAIIKIDPTGRENPVPVYQSSKPSFSVVGKDANGNDVHGFVDTASRRVTDINGQPIDASKLSGAPQFGFQTLPDGTILRTNPRDGTVQPAYQSAKPAFSVIGKDRDGNDVHGFVDPTTKKVYDLQGKPIDANSGLAGMSSGADSGLSGEEFLKSLNDRGRADLIKGMAEGRIAPAQMGRYGTAAVQSLLKDAARYEPGFDLTAWTGRSNGVKDFYGGGKSSEMVRAANQTIHHVGELVESMDKLNNTQYPPINTIGNLVGQKVLGKGAVTEFLPNAHAVAEEMSKVFKGANLSDAEIRQWESSLNQNMSPEQQRAAVGKLMSLLNGSLQALETKRRSSLGDVLSEKKGPLLDTDSQKTIAKVNQWIKDEPTTKTPTASVAAPAPGKYMFDPASGNLVPQQ